MQRVTTGDGSWPFGVPSPDGAGTPTEGDTGYVAYDQPVDQKDLDAQNGDAEMGTPELPL